MKTMSWHMWYRKGISYLGDYVNAIDYLRKGIGSEFYSIASEDIEMK